MASNLLVLSYCVLSVSFLLLVLASPSAAKRWGKWLQYWGEARERHLRRMAAYDRKHNPARITESTPAVEGQEGRYYEAPTHWLFPKGTKEKA